MKCPKCGYLGFEHLDRCRNCGYDFSLSAPAAEPDIAILRDTAVDPSIEDLALGPSRPAHDAADAEEPDLDGVLGGPLRARSGRPGSSTPGELPLFGPAIPGDEPLITKPSPPRAPLAVRRATPEVARVRAELSRPPSLDLSLDPEPAAAPTPIETEPPRGSWAAVDADRPAAEDATVSARIIAVVIDLMILAVIDAIVIYFTMQICDIALSEIGMLPKAPLIAFLLVQNGGYLVAFTAGGQTLGKMATGIRVVSADAAGKGETLDVGRAFLRTLAWLVLAIPAGLGFLPAIFSRDHRGLHDRFAGTRVVR
jgi:uncharacterized RDD family membrane protein YckC